MISLSGSSGAIIAYICWALVTVGAVIYLQGEEYIVLWLPSWVLSSIYPLAKRFVEFSQLVLGSALSCVLILLESMVTWVWREERN